MQNIFFFIHNMQKRGNKLFLFIQVSQTNYFLHVNLRNNFFPRNFVTAPQLPPPPPPQYIPTRLINVVLFVLV